MNFLNIEQNKILRIFFSKFHVFFTFHAISNIKKKIKIGVKKNWGGGGVLNFFFRKTILSSFHVLCYFQHYKKIILKSAPSLTG